MSEAHWKAEETRRGWGIRYNPTPGGVKNSDGTTSFSLSFIALELTDMVSDAEAAAKAIARELNCYSDLVASLKSLVGSGEWDEPDRPGHAMTGLRMSFGNMRRAREALSRAEGVA